MLRYFWWRWALEDGPNLNVVLTSHNEKMLMTRPLTLKICVTLMHVSVCDGEICTLMYCLGAKVAMNRRLHWSSNTVSDTNLKGPEYTSCKLTHTHTHTHTHSQSLCFISGYTNKIQTPPNDLHSVSCLPDNKQVWALRGVQMEKRGHVIWRISCGHIPCHHVQSGGGEDGKLVIWAADAFKNTHISTAGQCLELNKLISVTMYC